jgi:DNA-binding NtrC family response regulator
LPWHRRPRVFVLDDQPIIAETLAQVFESHGFEAHARSSASEILDLATELEPNLLLTDVALGPDTINGVDVAIYFARLYPNCRTILISGDPNTAELHTRARNAGHEFMLLQKPIHPEKLLEIVDQTLSHLERVA